MRTDYTDDDTARVRTAEHSSAGIQTQPLPALPPQLARFAPRSTGTRLAAIGLIIVGTLLLAGQVFGITSPLIVDRGAITAGMVLLTIASCFLFFAFWKRVYGLLIPGCILVGLSIGIPLADLSNGVSIMWGLALAFLSILFVGRGLFGVRSQWPVYPAVPLFAVGMLIAVSTLPLLFGFGLLWLPLALIGLGLYLGWGRT